MTTDTLRPWLPLRGAKEEMEEKEKEGGDGDTMKTGRTGDSSIVRNSLM